MEIRDALTFDDVLMKPAASGLGEMSSRTNWS